MSKPAKKIPKFATEVEERTFWESHDSTEYVAQRAELNAWQNAQTTSISRVWDNADDEVWNDVSLW